MFWPSFRMRIWLLCEEIDRLRQIMIKWLSTLRAIASTQGIQGAQSPRVLLWEWNLVSMTYSMFLPSMQTEGFSPSPWFRMHHIYLVLENMSCEDQQYTASQGMSRIVKVILWICAFKEACRDWNHWNLLSLESLCTLCRGKVCKNFERTSGAPTLTKMFVATCQFGRVVIGVLGCSRMDNQCFGLFWGMRDLSGHIVPTSERHRWYGPC